MLSSTSQATQLSSLLFSKLDTKKQGFIEKSDLTTAFSQIRGKSANSSGVDKVFSALDSNSDGKVTESEFASVLGKLQDQLASHRMHGHGGAQGMGDTPPPTASNAGFTQDELTQQLSKAGNTDNARSTLLTKIVNNFTAADANSDGRVSLQEAMAYDKSTQTTASTSTSSNNSGSSTADNSDSLVMKKIMQLVHAYGSSQGNAAGGIASLLSIVA